MVYYERTSRFWGRCFLFLSLFAVRSRSGSDATFEVPAVPKRAKRAPTPSSTPPRAAAKPKADSPFLPIKLP